MKADHRHELKTNLLAEWLGNFPEWAKENLIAIIAVSVVIVAAAAFFFWRTRSKRAEIEEQQYFTSLINQISNTKMQVLSAQAQGQDRSFLLLAPADTLRTFAQSTANNNLAALALIKRAEALRTELHYRLAPIRSQDLVTQITQARGSYTLAMEKASSNPSLRAAAKFGIGLCEEELGNSDKARQIYREVADDPTFEGTVTVEQARLRLDTMDDYAADISFKPAPKPKLPVPPKPIEIGPVDANRPIGANLPAAVKLRIPDANKAVEPPTSPAASQPEVIIETADVNAAAPEPNSMSMAPDANVAEK